MQNSIKTTFLHEGYEAAWDSMKKFIDDRYPYGKVERIYVFEKSIVTLKIATIVPNTASFIIYFILPFLELS
ncbi:hypothetical protein V7161_26940 [Neobacillus drentensis]|uniref:hypothetical protein n=1 Tax=Neobacillus drentensis TaxID=220684 RepID=UPI0030032DA7